MMLLIMTAFLGGASTVQAQAKFGKPIADEAPRASQENPRVDDPTVSNAKNVAESAVPQHLRPPKAPNLPQVLPDDVGPMPPTREQLFRVQSEEVMREWLRQEMPLVKNVDFPKSATVAFEAGACAFVKQVVAPVASQVCYRPLYFEDKRAERFGQYVPCIQPLISAGRFYGDVILLPYRLWQTPPWTFECDNR
jgi:hypothetical protein